jgi:PAS domain-containing protein
MSSEDLDLATKRDQDQRAEELRRSEFYLAEAQRLAHVGSWSFTPDGMREYWSAELFDILGFDPGRGVPPIPEYLKIVHPDDRERIKGEIERMVAKGEGLQSPEHRPGSFEFHRWWSTSSIVMPQDGQKNPGHEPEVVGFTSVLLLAW